MGIEVDVWMGNWDDASLGSPFEVTGWALVSVLFPLFYFLSHTRHLVFAGQYSELSFVLILWIPLAGLSPSTSPHCSVLYYFDLRFTGCYVLHT